MKAMIKNLNEVPEFDDSNPITKVIQKIFTPKEPEMEKVGPAVRPKVVKPAPLPEPTAEPKGLKKFAKDKPKTAAALAGLGAYAAGRAATGKGLKLKREMMNVKPSGKSKKLMEFDIEDFTSGIGRLGKKAGSEDKLGFLKKSPEPTVGPLRSKIPKIAEVEPKPKPIVPTQEKFTEKMKRLGTGLGAKADTLAGKTSEDAASWAKKNPKTAIAGGAAALGAGVAAAKHKREVMKRRLY